MFRPRHLLIGSIIAGFFGFGTLSLMSISASNDYVTEYKEASLQRACSDAMSQKFHQPVEKVSGYQNAGGGYTVLVNIDDGPDIRTGKWAVQPTADWGAECGFDKDGKIVYLGTYDIKGNVLLMWTQETDWFRISGDPLSNPVLKALEV